MITTRWEKITPKKAKAYLETNKSNRGLREATLDSYVADMRAGKWLVTHQGIAFNDRGELMDGQHRLAAIVKSEVTVKMLVTRGVPAVVGQDHTMDAVDRGAARSVADQLKLQHGFSTPAYGIAVLSVIANLNLQRRVKKQTVAQVLGAMDVYGRHISEIEKPLQNTRDKRFRRAAFGAALAFARAAEPAAVDRFVLQVTIGAGLAAGDAALTLRNYLLRPDGGSGRDMTERIEDCRLALNAIAAAVEGRPWPRLLLDRSGYIYFAGRQASQLAKLAQIYESELAALGPDRPGKAKRTKDLTPPPPPPRVITAKNFQLTPAAANLLKGIEMSDRAHRKAGTTR